MTSSRLPGKVLKPLLGKPMLARHIERLLRVKGMDKLVVATSVDPSDDVIAELASSMGLSCFRGSLDDVLDRYYQAARPWNPEHVIRVTGDCPLADPELIDELIAFYLAGNYDYAGNALEPTLPDGLDAEIFRFSALETAAREASLPSHREHVTLFINTEPARFKIGSYKMPVDRSHLRWTVDEPEDFELIQQVYSELYPQKPDFAFADILKLLERRPELCTLNTKYERNEGLQKSLVKDREALQKLAGTTPS